MHGGSPREGEVYGYTAWLADQGYVSIHNPAYADIIAVLQEHVSSAAADALRLPYSLGDAAGPSAIGRTAVDARIRACEEVSGLISSLCLPFAESQAEMRVANRIG